jgi:hypothetical protein
VIVVEHDEGSDHGRRPRGGHGSGAGVHGGEIVAQGDAPPGSRAAPQSLTGQYLSGRKVIASPARRRRRHGSQAPARHGCARQQPQERHGRHPPWASSCASLGVSGSGKSTLINDTLYNAVAHHPLRIGGRGRRARRDRGPRSLRQGDQRGPEPDRPHAALPIRRRTRDSSRRSAISSRACPSRARAATGPGASRST